MPMRLSFGCGLCKGVDGKKEEKNNNREIEREK